MQITREDLNPCTVKLAIVCDPLEVQEGYTRAYKQLAKKVKVPGFRPGHAPRHILETLLDRDDLNESAADIIVREAYKDALVAQELKPEPSVRPVVELGALDQAENKCEFTVKVPLPPQVDLGDPKGLPVQMPESAVSDEEIQYQVDELRQRRSTREPVTDRGAQEGDICVVNIKVEGDKEEGRNFMTVAGQTFPQLDQMLSGMRVEEMKSASLTFPENFQEKDWAGKPMQCQVSINSISAVKLPELDEEFAKALKTESVEDLKGRLRSVMEEAKTEAAREMVAEQALDALLERSTVNVPDAMWENIAERRLMETAQELHEAGKSMEDYAKENGMSPDELVEAWKHKAKIHVMRALIIRDLFAKEKMSLANADLSKELMGMASEYEVSPDEMLNLLKKNDAMEELHFRAISRKVTDFLIEHATSKAPEAERTKKTLAGAGAGKKGK